MAFRFDFSVMEQGDVADNGKAETCASGFAASASIRAVKTFKNAVYMLGGYADALVSYFDNKFPLIESENGNRRIFTCTGD
jgi:hypothetical protein